MGRTMTAEELHEFNEAQIEEMMKYKWIRSEEAGCDLGTKSLKEWIMQFAKSYREHWLATHPVNAEDAVMPI
jgi:hypothetical protein